METTTIGSGHEGSISEQLKSYWQKIKAGDMGSLPAVGALLFLAALFSDRKSTRLNSSH